ncbi:hypothetical protein ABAC460_16570 [Asticcacaulis sp. AC460]|uniref:hypothetical protein n=1 Tax=Asticcacaulis sp. AC460 TaxID=1282360 RepID=UPI0003C400D2|nr:hypothetical protein [Asticcacaulis sp. AC460]ESQ88273.1 hypothetical protein ABAC460_16570 [Asticcacaulis sp. AC460]
MRHFLILGAALCAVLVSCDRIQSWQHELNGISASSTSAIPASSFRTTTAITESEEARRLAAYPTLAVREGDILKVFHNGKLIASEKTVPCDGDGNADTCRQPRFWGMVNLLSSDTGKIEPYAVLDIGFWESGGYYIPLGKGRNFMLTGEPEASPDGRWLASGLEEVTVYDEDTELRIYDWAGGGKPVVFGPWCRPNGWSDNHTFTALCQDNSFATFEARADRDDQDRWRLTTTRILSVSNGPGAKAPRSAFEGVALEREP